MSKDSFFLADPPSTGYIATMLCIAVAGTLGLPLMIWLLYTGIYSHNWAMVAAALFAGLICAGLIQSWKSFRAAILQRRDGRRHSISIAGQKFVYRKDKLVQEIPIVDIISIEDLSEPSIGSRVRSVKITYRVADDKRSALLINAMEFSKATEKQDKLGVLLADAIRLNKD
jgi:hypothetical protein